MKIQNEAYVGMQRLKVVVVVVVVIIIVVVTVVVVIVKPKIEKTMVQNHYYRIQ